MSAVKRSIATNKRERMLNLKKAAIFAAFFHFRLSGE